MISLCAFGAIAVSIEETVPFERVFDMVFGMKSTCQCLGWVNVCLHVLALAQTSK